MVAVRPRPKRRKSLTSGKCEPAVRKATHDDLDAIKRLADEHREALGFVLRTALAKSIERGEIFVAENSNRIVGFVEYHHRRDEQTTLYHIAVQHNHRRTSIGRLLVQALLSEASQREKRLIQLKCPMDLEANKFYKRLGFSQLGIQNGRKRDLVIWQMGARFPWLPAGQLTNLPVYQSSILPSFHLRTYGRRSTHCEPNAPLRDGRCLCGRAAGRGFDHRPWRVRGPGGALGLRQVHGA